MLSTEYSEFEMTANLPDTVCHYYEAENGAFRNLSSMPLDSASNVLENIRQNGKAFAARRGADYLSIRRDLEARVRELFLAKGGQPVTANRITWCWGICRGYWNGANMDRSCASLSAHLMSISSASLTVIHSLPCDTWMANPIEVRSTH